MSRSKVSDSKRDEIVALKEQGKKWTEISAITGIERRTAKNAFDNWQKNSTAEEIRKVRSEVANTEFRMHIESLVKLARSLVSNLGQITRSIEGMKMNGDEFLDWLLKQDVLQRYSASSLPAEQYTPDSGLVFRTEDPRSYLDEKTLLYKSLRSHTRGDIRWNILDDDWKNARDRCAKDVPLFLKEVSDTVNNYIKNASDPKFLETVKRTTKENDPAKDMTELIVDVVWYFIMTNDMKEEPSFETKLRGEYVDIFSKFGRTAGRHFTLDGTENKYVAKEITKLCNAAVNLLSKTDIVKNLLGEVKDIRMASEALRESLNPLKISPIILRTQCDLCPVSL